MAQVVLNVFMFATLKVFRHFRPGRFEAVLLVVQMLLAGAVYGLLSLADHTVAEGTALSQ